MAKTAVHVTTLEQWKSVLDVWFGQGFSWRGSSKGYQEGFFENGGKYLFFDGGITWSASNPNSKPFIEYSDFMAQQKDVKEMEMYYVTQGQLAFLSAVHEELYSLDELLEHHTEAKVMFKDFSILEGSAVLRYLGGDETIEFKVKEKLYRLWRIDDDENKVYMDFSLTGNPDWTHIEDNAFTAPLEEINNWKTPAWDIEQVN